MVADLRLPPPPGLHDDEIHPAGKRRQGGPVGEGAAGQEDPEKDRQLSPLGGADGLFGLPKVRPAAKSDLHEDEVGRRAGIDGQEVDLVTTDADPSTEDGPPSGDEMPGRDLLGGEPAAVGGATAGRTASWVTGSWATASWARPAPDGPGDRAPRMAAGRAAHGAMVTPGPHRRRMSPLTDAGEMGDGTMAAEGQPPVEGARQPGRALPGRREGSPATGPLRRRELRPELR